MPAAAVWQAVLEAPGFCLGVCCDENAIHAIAFLPVTAEVAPRNALAAEAVRQLAAYLADAEYVFALPLGAAGTPFQRRVWNEIAAIPTHQTRTYGQIARVLHNAPRAVGRPAQRTRIRSSFPVIASWRLAVESAVSPTSAQGRLLEVKRWLLAHESC